MAKKQEIKREALAKIALSPRTFDTINVQRITFKPGQKAGLHLHPCPVTGYIAEGTAVVQIDNGEEQILKAGAAFYEPANVPVQKFDNFSASEQLVFVAFYLLNGEQELIKML
jgi:quercetin dioxygenase-like cupin family protein